MPRARRPGCTVTEGTAHGPVWPVRTRLGIAAIYFAAWKAKDFDTLRSILAEDVAFAGPFAQLDNAENCVEGLKGMSEITTDIVVHKRFVDGPNVLTWFDLHTSVAPRVPTAN